MHKLPPGEGRSSSEGADREQGLQTPLSVEALIDRRVVLEQKAQQLAGAREQRIKKLLSDREAVIAEDKRIDSLLAEAKKITALFEALDQQGLLTEPKDQEEFRVAKELVLSLENQRNELAQKYSGIMEQPEVRGEVETQAQSEGEQRDLEKRKKEYEIVLSAKLEVILEKKINLQREWTDLMQKETEMKRNLGIERQKLQRIVNQAVGSLEGPEHLETRQILYSFEDQGPTSEFLERLVRRRKQLTFLDRKEIKAIDYVLDRRTVALSFLQLYEDLIKIEGTEKGALTERSQLIEEEYLNLVQEATQKRGEFPAHPGQPSYDPSYSLSKMMRGKIEARDDRALSSWFSYLEEKALAIRYSK